MGSLNIQFQAKIFGNIVAKDVPYIHANFLKKKLTLCSLFCVWLILPLVIELRVNLLTLELIKINPNGII